MQILRDIVLGKIHQAYGVIKNNSTRVNEIMEILKSQNGTLIQFDDVVIRKVVEYIKIISSNKIQIVFKGGIEVVGEVE